MIEAAVACSAWHDIPTESEMRRLRRSLDKAVIAYRKATAPIEPFEAYLGYYHDDLNPLVSMKQPAAASRVWRCTVTPTERVR